MTGVGGRVLLLHGNQLFPIEALQGLKPDVVFMFEDHRLCTHFRYHQQKLVLILAAMRAYADGLRAAGYEVVYHPLNATEGQDQLTVLGHYLTHRRASALLSFEIEGKAQARAVEQCALALSIPLESHDSPMFLCPRSDFEQFMASRKRPQMAPFYQWQRRRLVLLMEDDGKPVGGKWSFDTENRKKLPKSVTPPEVPPVAAQAHVEDVIQLVRRYSADHPGDARTFNWPVTRQGALAWLDDFLAQRIELFGPYEDAMTTRSETLFHSRLSPLLNIGLITPAELVNQTLAHAQRANTPLQSVEGFIRQVIGWREFIRGVYQRYSSEQANANFWGHTRRLAPSWYAGDTGILPLDEAIQQVQRSGWTHHIPRLMVVANLMTLCEIKPRNAHEWFMEMFVDSASWVMGPNVYGMGLFSDGGIFATKPYICGANYMVKMSDYKKGPWCDVVDGLYWRFIHRHQDFFASNPRLALMPRALARLDDQRRERIFGAAEQFLAQHTIHSDP